VLRGEHDEPWLLPGDGLAGLDAEVVLGQRVAGLDTARRAVRGPDGWQPYDALVIATGLSPRRVPGLGGSVLRTLDESRELRGRLRPGSRLAVVGAGLIGCEVAASARSAGVEVDLIDVLAGPLIRVVGEQVCDLVADLHREHGVRLHMSTGAARADAGAAGDDAGPVQLALTDGTRLEADVLLQAVGGVPDTGWLEGSGLRLNDGVACDADGRAADGVYAAGDVARWDGHRGEHWTNAGEQADRVAAAILGQQPPPAAPAYWWSDQYDVKLQGIGRLTADDKVHLLRWGPRQRPLALYERAGLLSGVVGFSVPAAVMKLRADVIAGTPAATVLDRLAR
jgi:3-phenylpropionate/trans-cinnamate dioxygenase ferredoxin reductase subunit